MTIISNLTRREWLTTVGATALYSERTTSQSPNNTAVTASREPLRGVLMIVATPYTNEKAVDYEDLAAEVEFLDQRGINGLVWPQYSSDLPYLTHEERLHGMEVLADASRNRLVSLILGVQGTNTGQMLEYANHATAVGCDAMIAMPPSEAHSIDDYREYYTELCHATDKPIFIQTTGGAADRVEPTVEFIIEMSERFPNFGYVKEEYGDTLARMKQFKLHRPNTIKRIFGGTRARAWTYEMRLGMDGTMTGGPQYPEVYTQLWQLHLENRQHEVRELFSQLLMITNLEQYVPGLRAYLMQQRGVFKTHIGRDANYTFSPDAIDEIDYVLQPLKSYFIA